MATKAIVPRADGEGSVGTAAKHWAAGYFDSLPVAGAALGDITVQDTITLTDGADSHLLKAVQEAGLGGRMTIGLDETARTMVICDAGDVDVDFALVAATHPTLYIKSATGADHLFAYHDDTDAYFKTNDGWFVFQTDEGTNQNTLLKLVGKGSGYGVFRVNDEDNNDYVEQFCTSSGGYFKVGTGALKMMHDNPANVDLWGSTTSGNPKLTISGWDANAAARDTYSISAAMDAGAGTKLAIGLDETMRTMVICDAGDVDADLGLGVEVNPTLKIFSADKTDHLDLNAASFFADKGTYAFNFWGTTGPHFVFNVDLVVDNAFTFKSGAGDELTDTNARQAFLYLEPKIKQTLTAAVDCLYINATLTSLGDGSTGDGNNLFNLAVAGTSAFRIDTTGGIFPIGIKSGTDQANAGAAAGELYQDTNDDNTIKIGV